VVTEGCTVHLDGTGSLSADDGPLTYYWQQNSGPLVTLSNFNSVSPTFLAPQTGTEGSLLYFNLYVTDSRGMQNISGTLTIAVEDNGIDEFDVDVSTFWSYYEQPMGVKVSSSASLVGVDVIETPEELPPHVSEMEHGLIHLQLKPTGESETVTVTFHSTESFPSGSQWYTQLPDGSWIDVGDVLNRECTQAEIELDISENSNLEKNQDGILTFVSGLGVPETNTAGSHGSGGCFIDVLPWGR
jgi:hypothetical protein